MTTALGGPGVPCSAMRVRRLAAGELSGDERARAEDHLAACGRCQEVRREVEAERARVAAELPFEALAAGVAERLADPGAHGGRAPGPASPGRLRRATVAIAALAAAIVAAVAVPAVRRAVQGDGAGEGSRLKGGAAITVWVGEAGAARLLAPGEPVPAGAPLRIGLAPGAHRWAAVALVDADGAVVLHAGPAEAGPLPGAFEWVSAGDGTLVAVLADAPVDAGALAERLRRAGPAAAAPGPGAEVVLRTLRRSSR
jgi:hypothetical protein